MQVAALVLGVIAVGLWVWRLERHEQDAKRLQISEAVWKKGREAVRERIDGRPEWLRRLHRKWNAAGRLGERKRAA